MNTKAHRLNRWEVIAKGRADKVLWHERALAGFFEDLFGGLVILAFFIALWFATP